MTLDQNTTATTDFNVSEALRTLADMFYVGSIPEPTYPDQAVTISIHVPTAYAVAEFAGRMGITATIDAGRKGEVFTSAKLPIGTGSADHGCPEYVSAVVVNVVHVARAV